MPYRADVTEPDPNPNIISKYLSKPGLAAKLRIPLQPRQDPPYEAARLVGVRHFTSSV